MSTAVGRLLAQNGNRKLLVPFFTAGYPTLSGTESLVKTAIEAGADIIELGMPFSDPLADGPQIQFSSFVALANKISIKQIFNKVAQIRRFTDIPIVLMGYFNPILAYGEKAFFKDAAESGVSGFILADLPPEEASQAVKACQKNNLSIIFLVAPTSPKPRIKLVDKLSTDLVYAVTVTGVTGSGKLFDKSTDKYLKTLHNVLNKKYVAGFGVASAESARRLSRFADGVVIGSALVSIMKEARNQSEGFKKVGRLLKQIRRSI